MLFIFGSSGTNLVFERDIYFGGDPSSGFKTLKVENLEIAMASIMNRVNFMGKSNEGAL